ncbi:MAG: STAS domain-containing protein [Catenulisporales bacterium]|nr:STAS domain-containing protein [Catenulisporales bacterium]
MKTPPRHLAVTVAEPYAGSVLEPSAVTVIRAAGDVDIASCDALWSALETPLKDRRPVVLDASGVEFMDSAGLRTLLRADQLAHALRTSFVVAAPGDSLLRLLARTGMLPVLQVTPAVGNAATARAR